MNRKRMVHYLVLFKHHTEESAEEIWQQRKREAEMEGRGMRYDIRHDTLLYVDILALPWP